METTPSSLPSESYHRFKTWRTRRKIGKYLGAVILANGLVWGGSLFYLKHTLPSYNSELFLNVSVSGQGVNVNLPDVGQATTSTTSAFSSSSDPRENYKLIASSSMVLQAAAQSLKLSEKEFGKPHIKIIDNTTILKIELRGDSPTQAQQKAWTIYRVLNQRLNVLRSQEQAQRDKAIRKAVNEVQSKLTQAQQRLSDYKTKSGLSSSKQVSDLISNIEELRKQRSEMIAQEQQMGDHLQQLSASLQLSPQEAAKALLLQTDQQLQQSLKTYTEATSSLNTLQESLGKDYPDVVAAKRQQEAALATVLERGRILLGQPVSQLMIERLSLDNSGGSGVKRGELFQQLITLQSEHQGLVGQINAITQQIHQLEQRLNILVQKESILDSRLRDLQIAEVVFTSTLAKVDLGKNDPFGSFPLLQLIEEPSLPDEPISPKTTLVYIGTFLGSFLVTLGLTLIWWRTPILAVTKKFTRSILE